MVIGMGASLSKCIIIKDKNIHNWINYILFQVKIGHLFYFGFYKNNRI